MIEFIRLKAKTTLSKKEQKALKGGNEEAQNIIITDVAEG